MLIDSLRLRLKKPAHDTRYRTFWQSIHIDIVLLTFLALLCTAGLVVLYSASSQNPRAIQFQFIRLVIASCVMFIVAQIPPISLQRYAFWIYLLSLFLLIVVLGVGHIGKGAQRWINLGIMRFQPSELAKIVVCFLVAKFFYNNL